MAKKPSIKTALSKAKAAAAKTDGPSPNPMTNLLITGLALRGGGQVLRHVVERAMLGAKFSPATAKNIVGGRTMVQTLLETAAVRIATRSVPGAILIGGGLLAKTLFERRADQRSTRAKGQREIAAQAKRGAQDDADT